MSTLIYSCKKEGVGGESSISGNIRSSFEGIGSSTVYLKYGEDTYTALSISEYDDIKGVAAGESFVFSNLNRGDYYVFAVAYDTICGCELIGGTGVSNLGRRDHEQITINVRQ
ncbi:MAG: hypothetical protein MRY83_13485 [Flavobacteriales bacterium]|nr:hypothetical protein [Flavobacteriales bacterium]